MRKGPGISRRSFLGTSATATAFIVAAPRLSSAEKADAGPAPPELTLNVNGRDHHLAVDPRVTLLDALREHIGLMGTKKGCDRGQCGACTVLLNGRRVNSCLTLALSCDGYKVVTVEGLANGETLHPVQAAFLARDAFQCGYCTPAQIVSAVACIAEGHATDADSVREWMSGNICRCSAYPQITAAVLEAAAKMKG